ncbi:MAG: bifunctional riboflavin kinase/FAD synthetase [Gammaproteobacteria bacterium]|nr:bifunctional riboflavin kinase/FAD synthetase [Gammaproteobacteria bacterium]MDE0247435.1 bifunctional riboflavin kinase/FAD synthetase [Gammaproteobacteria bacterium]
MPDRVIDPALPSGIPSDGRGTVVTVGTFDGVHLGHRAVLEEIRDRASATGRRAVLLTFHPHPLRIVRPEATPPLLTTPVEKKEILAETGLDYAVFLTFSPALSRYSPRRFVEEILVGRLRLDELVIGHDHGFGRGRSGDVTLLREIGTELGFAVDVVEPVLIEGAAVSSSLIRKAVSEGQLEAARTRLGRPYSARGVVVRGEQRGRDLGFPTANLSIDATEKLLPPSGIYAVRGVLKRGVFAGALHLGPRPTFQGSPPSIELYLLDFDGEIYGEEVRVDFIRFLRPVRAFGSVASLIRQMELDVAEVRRVLSNGR